MSETPQRRASTAQLALAFAAIYVIWGSTYLGIRYALDTLPPMLLAATRHLTAGLLLYGFSRLRGAPRPRRSQWPSAIVIGTLMLACGNGGVVLAEQRVPSGIAAILIATVPLFTVVLDWLWKGAARPSPQVLVGVGLGMLGLAILTGVGTTSQRLDPVGILILLTAALTWAIGTLYSRTSPLPPGFIGVSMEMLAGGAVLLVGGTLHGEWSGVHPAAVSLSSLLGLLYLIAFGSLVGFTAYNFLIKNVSPAKATTYAFVNPVVAVILGSVVLKEPLTPRVLVGAAIILGALALITTARARTLAPELKKVHSPGVDAGAREAEAEG